MNSEHKVVSICMITYNHEPFIREAIESVLMQKCNFSYEFIIGEDYSTDKTRQICLEYSSKYAEIILLPSETNLGIIPNFIRTLKACTGKYIAICEGDDYWLDPYKLQKQIEFLQKHYEYSLAFTDYICVDSLSKKMNKISFPEYLKRDFTLEDILNFNIPPTRTLVFRNNQEILNNPLINNFYGGDVYICALLLEKLKGAYLDFKSAAWRIHETGIYSMKPEFHKRINILKDAKLLKKIFLNKVYQNILNNTISNQYKYLYVLSLFEKKISFFIISLVQLIYYDFKLKKINFLKANYYLIRKSIKCIFF